MSSLASIIIILSIIATTIHAIRHQDYFVVSNTYPFNFEQANSYCDGSTPRGQLASSHNTSHDNMMHNLCQSTGSESCWIGLYRDESNDNQWKWMDNSEFSHTLNHDQISSDIDNTKSCISLLTSSDAPTWSNSDCMDSLQSAVCSTCGELDEYCCNLGNECNGDHMDCVDNICVESIFMESTNFFSTSTSSYKFDGTSHRGIHYDHPSTIAIMVVILLVIVFNVICCMVKRRKLRMIEDYEYEEHCKRQRENLRSTENSHDDDDEEVDIDGNQGSYEQDQDERMAMDPDTNEDEEEILEVVEQTI